MKKWVKKLLPPTMICLVVAIVISISVGYFNFISKQSHADSERHLKEVYGQISRSFLSFIDRNWELLDSCNEYIHLADLEAQDFADEESAKQRFESTVSAFIDGKRSVLEFTDFYFLKKDRTYRTLAEKEGKLGLDASWDSLIENGEPIMASEKIDSQSYIFFATAAKYPGSYKGFEYDAIAICYTNSALARSLDAEAFNGEANCFIIQTDGSIILATDPNKSIFKDYFAYLSSGMQIDDGNLARIREDLKKKREGYLQCELIIKGVKDEHCIIYMPVGYQDYFLLSDVPQATVSQGFMLAQRATMRVLLIIFGIVGIVAFILLLIHLFSQSRKNKTELQYRERMFDVLSNNVDDIFIMIDHETQKVDYVSPNVERLLGIPLKDVRGDLRSMAKCAVDYNIIIPKEELGEIPLNGNKFWECEYMHQTTGERRWYRVTIYNMSIQKVNKYVVVMSDRTVEQQMNQKLQEALDAAKSANEAKSNFLSNMSHDIRTPMNAIVGFSVLLEKDADQVDKVHEYTRKIMASSHHLLSLINDVLDMSKIESGKTSLNVDRFSLPELLEELNIILMPQAKAKKQSFTITTKGTPPEEILGDKLRLNQILINLLSNAIKYTPENGNIFFTVRELPHEMHQYAKLQFIVKDDGIGMSEDFQKEIFAPFSREINSVTNKIQGTGLGMAITKNLVDLMGGVISVESAPGKGSTFTVEMSFALPETNEANEWYHQKVTRMLVADDEEDICLNIKEMMRGTGVDVTCANDGPTAIGKAVNAHRNGNDYHVILLDWKMPGMDGVETAKAIRDKIGADVPILVLTSYDWSEIETEARQAGINAFMPKPFFASTFWQTIKPFFSDHIEEMAAPQTETDSNALKDKLFLVAEDNELNAEILTEMLALEGASCELAVNGKEALEMFTKAEPGHYDMVLMDVQMPVMNGYESTKAIRASNHPQAKSIPIVAMTANTFAEDVRNALDAGMDGHLAKPIDMQAVRNTVARLLHKNN